MKVIFTSIILLLISGCSSIGYYFDAVNGHLTILANQESIRELIQEDKISAELKSKLILATKAREFASSELLLPDNDSYRYYSDIKRPYVVWNVIATKKYSIKARQWCFLVVGCVSYRGYFNQEDAKAYAATLAKQGYDVNVAGAHAYSTLGWFDDPLLNTMISRNEARLVGVLFHELAHQQLYINNDSSFNEAFASSVEIEGVKRWFARQSVTDTELTKKAFQDYRVSRKRTAEFKQLLKATQEKLDGLFTSDKFHTAKDQQGLKQAVFTQLQQDYLLLKKSWQDYSGYDKWMQRELNNAHLALVATYYNKVPAFQAVLKSVNNDIKKYYKQVKAISLLSTEKRNQTLDEFLEQDWRNTNVTKH